jgi:hypothetical protein
MQLTACPEMTAVSNKPTLPNTPEWRTLPELLLSLNLNKRMTLPVAQQQFDGCVRHARWKSNAERSSWAGTAEWAGFLQAKYAKMRHCQRLKWLQNVSVVMTSNCYLCLLRS